MRAPAHGGAAQPVVLEGAEWQDLRDAASGHTWRVWVQAPPSAPPPGGHAVLYVLDGATCFVLAAQLARNAMARPPDVRGSVPIVVGIGHPGHAPDHAARQRDYTPPAPPGERADAGQGEGKGAGGADALLDFIAHQVQPMVQARWPVNRARQTLYGHSLAGLFTAYALLARPGLFGAHVAASPSLWWGGGAWLDSVPALLHALPAPLHARVSLRVGMHEDAAHASSPARAAVLAERRPVGRTRAMADMLTQHARAHGWTQLHTRFAAYPGLDHGEVMPRALLGAFALTRQTPA
ncbi:MAG: alpha/beta hydrolase-fold protein [Pseudomonadota bacterium]|nr:alpha/beta hydrolase-fold protein [Pseudomonadota bacterium]